MIKYLRIQNLILVEEAELAFKQGLNILTGETGAGKSAIMHGLSLALGDRADTALIRRGSEKGAVEAIFDGDLSTLYPLLSEGGIDHEIGEELIIRREISQSGKGRIFINQQPVQLSFLRKLGNRLVQMVGQHTNHSLFSLDTHRELLDLFGNLSPLLHSFQENFEQENSFKKQLELLIGQEAQRLREIAICQKELEELDDAHLKEGEEEELSAEQVLLSNSEELSQKMGEIHQVLTGERTPLLSVLNRQKQTLESLVKFDPSLQEYVEILQNAHLELQEVAYSLQRYHSNLIFDPLRLQKIDDRLALIHQLKKKYGSSVEEILNYRTETEAKLKKLENCDIEVEELKAKLSQIKERTDRSAQELSAKRKDCAAHFEKEVTIQLHSLNMSKAVFSIEINRRNRTLHGDDHIEFFLSPNLGENKIALKEGISGGEISRVLLALQTLLAGKEKRETLIFDEVDANIGGETAKIVGEKLKEIGRKHQLICITHFPQVAVQADSHFQISKKEKEGRTFTKVKELDSLSRSEELLRMAGHSPVLT